MDFITSLNEDGTINADYYKNATIDIIEREAQQIGLDPNKLDANRLKSFLRTAYYSLFKPSKPLEGNNACNVPYNSDNITTLFNIYVEICEKYNCIPSMVGFGRYTGLTEETTFKYVTGARLAMTKFRGDFVLNRLSDSPIGNMGLANNDTTTGLMWNRQNIIERETVKQGLTLSDFVQISQKE